MLGQLVKRDATLNDTIELIRTRINQDYRTPFVQRLVASLYSKDPDQFSRNLFNYVYRNVRYQLDPKGREYVYKPSTTVVNGVGDCKKMTVLIGSALKAYGIDPYLKHVFYKNEDYTHIYPIIPRRGGGYIVLDPVNNGEYNAEVRHDFANVYNLNGKKMDLFTGARPQLGKFKDGINTAAGDIHADLATITGCTSRTTGQVSDAITEALTAEISGEPSLGRRKTKEQRKENRKKVLEKFKNVAKKGLGAGMRGAFLVVIGLNVRNLASKLTQAWAKDPKGIETIWIKFGGDPKTLKKNILEGSKKKPLLAAAPVVATVAAALPVIAAFVKKLNDLGILKKHESESLAEMEEDAEDKVSSGEVDPEKTAKDAPKDKDDDKPPTPPSAGSFILNRLNTPLDYVGAILKIGILSAPLCAMHPEYVNEINAGISALFVAYIVKLKFF